MSKERIDLAELARLGVNNPEKNARPATAGSSNSASIFSTSTARCGL